MGGEEYDEKPVHSVSCDAYAIAKYAVTNAQYERFVKAEGFRPPDHWKGGVLEPYMANQPVVYVSWHEAQAYCRWLSQTTGRDYRLPTEAEWEKAARGRDQRKWPWGNEFDRKLANTYEGKGDWTTTPVSLYPEVASPYGIMDMAGNVWEWCSTLYRDYPYRADDGRESLEADGPRVLRGGSWFNPPSYARCAYRYRYLPGYRYLNVGFRVAASHGFLDPAGSAVGLRTGGRGTIRRAGAACSRLVRDASFPGPGKYQSSPAPCGRRSRSLGQGLCNAPRLERAAGFPTAD